jgi:CheY-like chemotaxis protein
MDIVAKTIEQLHGRIEVDSAAGVGTTMRLMIPLRTGIEHVMVFRVSDQLFAIPMQSVTAAKSSSASQRGNIKQIFLASALSLKGKNKSSSEDALFLRRSHDLARQDSGDAPQANDQLALLVDELVGPEEVVVRGLPNLLNSHPLFCGVTLSGSGEKVLLINTERVLDFCHQNQLIHSADNRAEPGEAGLQGAAGQDRALVVDDSLTARKVLVKILQQHGFATVEAGDGFEAIERLHKEQFDLVLTDLDMPRFGGLELLSDIQSGSYCDAPVVVVSGRGEEAFRIKAMDVGAVDFLTKPVSKTSITQLLEDLQLLPQPIQG